MGSVPASAGQLSSAPLGSGEEQVVRILATTTIVLPLVLLLGCSAEGEGRESEMKTERVTLEVNEIVLAGNDSFAVIEPVWWTANIYDSLSEYEWSLKPFSSSQRMLFALHWYIAEVNNGGHHQFYFNSTGIVWPDALEAFRLIGVPEGAEILRESADRLGGSPSRERGARQRRMDELSPDFEDLDDRFYELQERVDLNAKMLEFARAHSADFRFTGTIERPVLGGGDGK